MINLNDKKYKPKVDITKDDLLKLHSENDIFRNYVGDFELGETYRSPLRKDDDTPSFNIFYSKANNCLLFKDFAGKRGDCIRFVQYLYSLPTYQDAIKQVIQDMGTSHSITLSPKKVRPQLEKPECQIKIVVRNWTDEDLSWWNQFGISQSTLKRYNVVPIKGYYSNDKYVNTKDIAYAYLEYKDKNLTYKIYRPTADKNRKWRNNNPFGVHQGYTQLPFTSPVLIITKSLKDVMAIWELTDIPAIGVQSETCFIKDSVVDEYKFRFDKVYTLFDNDRQGREQAESYSKMYDIPAIFIPDEYEVKDFSDLVKHYGKKFAIEVLNNLIK